MTAIDDAASKGEPVTLGYRVPDAQRLTYTIEPQGGGLMNAAAIGAQLEAIGKLLKRVANDESPDVKWVVALLGAYTTAAGAFIFEVMITPEVPRK